MGVIILAGQFCLHVVCGTFLFCVIGFAAVCVHWFVDWVQAQGLWIGAVYGLAGVEALILVGDILAFVLFFSVILWSFSKETWRQTNRGD